MSLEIYVKHWITSVRVSFWWAEAGEEEFAWIFPKRDLASAAGLTTTLAALVFSASCDF